MREENRKKLIELIESQDREVYELHKRLYKRFEHNGYVDESHYQHNACYLDAVRTVRSIIRMRDSGEMVDCLARYHPGTDLLTPTKGSVSCAQESKDETPPSPVEGKNGESSPLVKIGSQIKLDGSNTEDMVSATPTPEGASVIKQADGSQEESTLQVSHQGSVIIETPSGTHVSFDLESNIYRDNSGEKGDAHTETKLQEAADSSENDSAELSPSEAGTSDTPSDDGSVDRQVVTVQKPVFSEQESSFETLKSGPSSPPLPPGLRSSSSPSSSASFTSTFSPALSRSSDLPPEDIIAGLMTPIDESKLEPSASHCSIDSRTPTSIGNFEQGDDNDHSEVLELLPDASMPYRHRTNVEETNLATMLMSTQEAMGIEFPHMVPDVNISGPECRTMEIPVTLLNSPLGGQATGTIMDVSTEDTVSTDVQSSSDGISSIDVGICYRDPSSPNDSSEYGQDIPDNMEYMLSAASETPDKAEGQSPVAKDEREAVATPTDNKAANAEEEIPPRSDKSILLAIEGTTMERIDTDMNQLDIDEEHGTSNEESPVCLETTEALPSSEQGVIHSDGTEKMNENESHDEDIDREKTLGPIVETTNEGIIPERSIDDISSHAMADENKNPEELGKTYSIRSTSEAGTEGNSISDNDMNDTSIETLVSAGMSKMLEKPIEEDMKTCSIIQEEAVKLDGDGILNAQDKEEGIPLNIHPAEEPLNCEAEAKEEGGYGAVAGMKGDEIIRGDSKAATDASTRSTPEADESDTHDVAYEQTSPSTDEERKDTMGSELYDEVTKDSVASEASDEPSDEIPNEYKLIDVIRNENFTTAINVGSATNGQILSVPHSEDSTKEKEEIHEAELTTPCDDVKPLDERADSCEEGSKSLNQTDDGESIELVYNKLETSADAEYIPGNVENTQSEESNEGNIAVVTDSTTERTIEVTENMTNTNNPQDNTDDIGTARDDLAAEAPEALSGLERIATVEADKVHVSTPRYVDTTDDIAKGDIHDVTISNGSSSPRKEGPVSASEDVVNNAIETDAYLASNTNEDQGEELSETVTVTDEAEKQCSPEDVATEPVVATPSDANVEDNQKQTKDGEYQDTENTTVEQSDEAQLDSPKHGEMDPSTEAPVIATITTPEPALAMSATVNPAEGTSVEETDMDHKVKPSSNVLQGKDEDERDGVMPLAQGASIFNNVSASTPPELHASLGDTKADTSEALLSYYEASENDEDHSESSVNDASSAAINTSYDDSVSESLETQDDTTSSESIISYTSDEGSEEQEVMRETHNEDVDSTEKAEAEALGSPADKKITTTQLRKQTTKRESVPHAENGVLAMDTVSPLDLPKEDKGSITKAKRKAGNTNKDAEEGELLSSDNEGDSLLSDSSDYSLQSKSSDEDDSSIEGEDLDEESTESDNAESENMSSSTQDDDEALTNTPDGVSMETQELISGASLDIDVISQERGKIEVKPAGTVKEAVEVELPDSETRKNANSAAVTRGDTDTSNESVTADDGSAEQPLQGLASYTSYFMNFF